MASQTVIDDTVSATTKQTEKVSSDTIEKAAEEDATVLSRSPTRHPSGSPEPNCAICLGKLENKSFTDSCFHMFCFVCLLEWSKVKAECPLCKQPFKSIVHNVRSYEDYDQYHLEEQTEGQDAARFRYRTTMTLERFLHVRQREMQRQIDLLQHPSNARTRYRTRRQNATAEFRRRIYTEGLHVVGVRDSQMRRRNITPEFYSANATCCHRLVPWLNREINALLFNQTEAAERSQFIMELVLGLIKRYHITSEEFYQHVFPFIGRHTRHFMREFEAFASSPYCIVAYDQHAIYEPYTQQIESDSESSQGSNPIVISPERSTPLIIADDPTPMSNSPSSDPVVVIREPCVESENEGVEPTPVPENISVQPPVRLASSGWDSPIAGPSWQETPANQSVKSIETNSNSPSVDASCKIKQEWNDYSDWDSDNSDVIIVGFEKPWKERSPVLLSSTSGEEDNLVQLHHSKRRRSNRERDLCSSRYRDRYKKKSPDRSLSRSHYSSSRSYYHDASHHSNRRHSRSPERRFREYRHIRSRSREYRRRSRSREHRHRSRSREYRHKSQSREPKYRRSRSRERETYTNRYVREPSPAHSHRSHESSKYRSRETSRYDLSKSSKSRKRTRRDSNSDDIEIIEDRHDYREKSKKHKKHKRHKHKHRKEDKHSEQPVRSASPESQRKASFNVNMESSSKDSHRKSQNTAQSNHMMDKSDTCVTRKTESPTSETSPSQSSDKHLFKKHPTGHKQTKSSREAHTRESSSSRSEKTKESSYSRRVIDAGIVHSHTDSNKETLKPTAAKQCSSGAIHTGNKTLEVTPENVIVSDDLHVNHQTAETVNSETTERGHGSAKLPNKHCSGAEKLGHGSANLTDKNCSGAEGTDSGHRSAKLPDENCNGAEDTDRGHRSAKLSDKNCNAAECTDRRHRSVKLPKNRSGVEYIDRRHRSGKLSDKNCSAAEGTDRDRGHRSDKLPDKNSSGAEHIARRHVSAKLPDTNCSGSEGRDRGHRSDKLPDKNCSDTEDTDRCQNAVEIFNKRHSSDVADGNPRTDVITDMDFCGSKDTRRGHRTIIEPNRKNLGCSKTIGQSHTTDEVTDICPHLSEDTGRSYATSDNNETNLCEFMGTHGGHRRSEQSDKNCVGSEDIVSADKTVKLFDKTCNSFGTSKEHRTSVVTSESHGASEDMVNSDSNIDPSFGTHTRHSDISFRPDSQLMVKNCMKNSDASAQRFIKTGISEHANEKHCASGDLKRRRGASEQTVKHHDMLEQVLCSSRDKSDSNEQLSENCSTSKPHTACSAVPGHLAETCDTFGNHSKSNAPLEHTSEDYGTSEAAVTNDQSNVTGTRVNTYPEIVTTKSHGDLSPISDSQFEEVSSDDNHSKRSFPEETSTSESASDKTDSAIATSVICQVEQYASARVFNNQEHFSNPSYVVDEKRKEVKESSKKQQPSIHHSQMPNGHKYSLDGICVKTPSLKSGSAAQTISESSGKANDDSSSSEEGEISSSEEESIDVTTQSNRAKNRQDFQRKHEVHEITSGSDVEIEQVDRPMSPSYNHRTDCSYDSRQPYDYNYHTNQYPSMLSYDLYLYRERLMRKIMPSHDVESVDIQSSSEDEALPPRSIGNKKEESMVISSDESETENTQASSNPRIRASEIQYDTISSESEVEADDVLQEMLYDESLPLRGSSGRDFQDI